MIQPRSKSPFPPRRVNSRRAIRFVTRSRPVRHPGKNGGVFRNCRNINSPIILTGISISA
jgi:hypothetical protein